MDDPLAEAVARATGGDHDALDQVIRAIQHRVYGLALRMLGHPEDAADATQEILIKVITHLGQFRGQSAVTTWVYRIAANHLLTARTSRREQRTGTFDDLDAALEAGLAFGATADEDTPHAHALLEEVRISCTQGMLLCLDREQRLAFILGVVFNVSSAEGGAILAITPVAFRQRLARARRALRAFMDRRCGLVNANAACQCGRQVRPAIQSGRLDPAQLTYAAHPTVPSPLSPAETAHARGEIVALGRVAGVFRSHPQYRAPADFVAAVRQLVAAGTLRILD